MKLTVPPLLKKYSFLWVISVALIVRLIYLYYYSKSPFWAMLTVDNYYHHHWAEVLASGELFGGTTYFRAPGYPFLLGFMYFIFGSSIWVGRIVGLCIGLASVSMTFVISRTAFNRRTAIIATIIHALYPICIYFDYELLLDPFFTLLLQIAVYCFLLTFRSNNLRLVVISGSFFGFASITRPTALVVAGIATLFLIWYYDASGLWLKRIVLFLFGIALCIAPITVRNLVVAEDPVLIASQGGINLYLGNNPDANGVSAVMPMPLGYNWRIKQIELIAEKDMGFRPKPGDLSSYWLGKATAWAVAHPTDFLTLFAKKIVYSFSNKEISNNRDLQQHFRAFGVLDYIPLSFGLLLPFSLLAILMGWQKHREIKFLTFTILTYLFAGAMFFFSSRFRLPILPFIFVLTGYAFSVLRDIKGYKRSIAISIVMVSFAIGLFSFFPPVTPPATNAPQFELAQAKHYFNKGEYRKALRFAHSALSVDSSYVDVNLTIGSCYFRLGLIDSALAYYEKELRLYPQRSQAYTNLASLLLTQENPEVAIEIARRALDIEPSSIDANLIQLRAMSTLPQYDPSDFFEHVRRAGERTEYDLQVMMEGGVLLTNHVNYDRALAILNDALKTTRPPIETDDNAFDQLYRNSPANRQKMLSAIHYQIGYILGRKAIYGESIRHSLIAIELDSLRVEAYINLIGGYASIGQTKKADSVLVVAKRKFPTNQLLNQQK